jgi:hypothetical protein
MPILAFAKSTPLVTMVFVLLLLPFQVSCTRSESPSPAAKESASSNAAVSKPATASESSLPDPCTLLSKAEAESILGSPVKDPEPNSLGGNKICDYNTVKLYGGIAPYSIHIAITPESRKVWDAGKKLHADAKESHPVAGVGEEAYFITDELDIFSNQRSINITVLKDIDRPTHMKSVQEAEKTVAHMILPRMK